MQLEHNYHCCEYIMEEGSLLAYVPYIPVAGLRAVNPGAVLLYYDARDYIYKHKTPK